MHLTWPSMTRVYDSDRSKDAVTFKPRYSSLIQYSLRNIKERWDVSLLIRALLVSGRWLAIQLKIRSSLPQAWGGFSGPPGVLSRCLGRVLPRVLLLFAWHIHQQSRVGTIWKPTGLVSPYLSWSQPGAMGRVAWIGNAVTRKSGWWLHYGLLAYYSSLLMASQSADGPYVCAINSCSPIWNMQLNVLNDLAEAMKALNGKKDFKPKDLQVLGRPFWAKPVLRMFSGPRIGPVGGSCFVDDFVSCWGKRGAYRLLLELSWR